MLYVFLTNVKCKMYYVEVRKWLNHAVFGIRTMSF